MIQSDTIQQWQSLKRSLITANIFHLLFHLRFSIFRRSCFLSSQSCANPIVYGKSMFCLNENNEEWDWCCSLIIVYSFIVNNLPFSHLISSCRYCQCCRFLYYRKPSCNENAHSRPQNSLNTYIYLFITPSNLFRDSVQGESVIRKLEILVSPFCVEDSSLHCPFAHLFWCCKLMNNWIGRRDGEWKSERDNRVRPWESKEEKSLKCNGKRLEYSVKT